MDGRKLSLQLSEKIDTLISAYLHLKDENEMLRDELQTSKAFLQECEAKLHGFDGQAEIKESELELIIEKLEFALNSDTVDNANY